MSETLTKEDATDVKMACYNWSTALSKASHLAESEADVERYQAGASRVARLADRFLRLESEAHRIVPAATVPSPAVVAALDDMRYVVGMVMEMCGWEDGNVPAPIRAAVAQRMNDHKYQAVRAYLAALSAGETEGGTT